MEGNNNISGVESQPANPQPESQPATGVIYKITNTIDGKIYIGKTKQKLSKRISQHKCDSKKGSLGIGAAIRKYGWENFTVEVIEECPIELLNEREIFFIAELNSKSPHGYNLTDGGDGGKGYSPNKETRDKISVKLKSMGHKPPSQKGKTFSKEHKANISAAKTGKKRKPLSKGHKKKISAKLKGIKRSPETRARMSVAQKVAGKKPPSQKGKKRSPETIARMSVAQKARWAKKKLESQNNK